MSRGNSYHIVCVGAPVPVSPDGASWMVTSITQLPASTLGPDLFPVINIALHRTSRRYDLVPQYCM